MSELPPPSSTRSPRAISRPPLLPLVLSSALALSATACGSSDATGDGKGGAGGTDSGATSGSASAETSASSGAGEASLATQLCLDTINMYRATLDLPPYQRWTEKEACATDEATQDFQSGTGHGAFGQCGEFAQNECPDWSAPAESMIADCLAQMWAEGPGTDFSKHGHYLNMSSTKYTKVACGFSSAVKGVLWAVQDFQ